MEIEINRAMVDYLTVTTRDVEIANKWRTGLVWCGGNTGDKIKRYIGDRGIGEWSGLFVGESVGRAKKHYIMQCSGAKADECLEWLDPFELSGGEVRVTRIDVQVTISQPVGWSQIGYMASCESAGLKPELRRSKNPVDKTAELMTVYTGTKTSGRLNRLYQKVTEMGELLVRYETEFSRGYSKAVAFGLLSGSVTKGQVIRGEIKRRKIDGLRVFDLWQGSVFRPKCEQKILFDKRAEWLLCSILPVFVSYINGHGADVRVREGFLNAIESQEDFDG